MNLVTGTKRCPRCGEVKPRTEFGRHVGHADGLATNCKPCAAVLQRDYRAANYAHIRAWEKRNEFRRKYGITVERYDELLAEQDGVCAICSGPPFGKSDRFYHVDHDHETGAIRGLLCHSCNLLLAQARDSVDRLHAAIAYLERSQESQESQIS